MSHVSLSSSCLYCCHFPLVSLWPGLELPFPFAFFFFFVFLPLFLICLPASCGVSDSFCGPVSQHLPHQAPFPTEPSTVAGLFRGRVLKALSCTFSSRSKLGFFRSVEEVVALCWSILWFMYGRCSYTRWCRNNKSEQRWVYRAISLCVIVWLQPALFFLVSSWRILHTAGSSAADGRRTPSGLRVCFWSQSYRRRRWRRQPQFWWWGHSHETSAQELLKSAGHG